MYSPKTTNTTYWLDFLDGKGLLKYKDALIQEGLENMELLNTFDEEDITEIIKNAGVKKVHQRVLRRAIQAFKKEGWKDRVDGKTDVLTNVDEKTNINIQINHQNDEIDIDIFFKHFELTKYQSVLHEAGLDNIQIIHELEEEDINELITDVNMEKSDIKKFRNAINDVKKGTYNCNPNEHKYEPEEEYKYESEYHKIEYNKELDINNENNKTIIFIGESGVGKTTLINSMCNYLSDIKYNDKFRYKLIYENEKKENNTQNQTQNINTYNLNSKDLSKINSNYSLTIIDTPGFYNIINDTIIQNEFKKCFEEIKFIDAIYVVVKATETRLNDAQKYMFNVIYKLFAFSDICILFTFSDGSDPPALKAIEKINIKYNKYFKINNSGFTVPANNNNNTHKMFYNLGMKQFDIIFNELNNVHVKPKSTKQIVENIKKWTGNGKELNLLKKKDENEKISHNLKTNPQSLNKKPKDEKIVALQKEINKYKLEIESWKQKFISLQDEKKNEIIDSKNEKKELTIANAKIDSLNEEITRLKTQNVIVQKRNEQLMEEQKEYKLKMKLCDSLNYKEWDVEHIVDWILKLDDGRFLKYEQKLKKSLIELGINGKELKEVNGLVMKGWGIVDVKDKEFLQKQINELIKT